MDFRFKYRRTKPAAEEKQRETREDKDTLRRMRGLAIGMSIPMSLVAGPVAGWLIGAWLDKLMGTGFWMIVLILLGMAAGIWTTIEMLMKLGRE